MIARPQCSSRPSASRRVALVGLIFHPLLQRDPQRQRHHQRFRCSTPRVAIYFAPVSISTPHESIFGSIPQQKCGGIVTHRSLPSSPASMAASAFSSDATHPPLCVAQRCVLHGHRAGCRSHRYPQHRGHARSCSLIDIATVWRVHVAAWQGGSAGVYFAPARRARIQASAALTTRRGCSAAPPVQQGAMRSAAA